MRRLWPKSLAGQLLVAVALALLLAQVINSVLVYRGQRDQIEDRLAGAAAIRLVAANEWLGRGGAIAANDTDTGQADPRQERRWRSGRTRLEANPPVLVGQRPLPGVEDRLIRLLDNYGVAHGDVRVAWNKGAPPRLETPKMHRRERRLAVLDGDDDSMMLAAMQRPDSQWLTVRLEGPPRGERLLGWLVLQTLILYLVVMLPITLLVRRFSRPLSALTHSVETFRLTQTVEPIDPSGPQDIVDLITAFNAMSHRISGMLGEKDVMLGAIGHDLKTPLAALRVRVESVDDDALRARMVAGIEDITRTLDDILILARVGRPLAPPEPVNLTALVETIVEECADLEQNVTLADGPRIVVPLQVTWMRRAVRNLVGNAVRYGHAARISLNDNPDSVHIRIEDDGPGIPPADITRMFEPFTRLEASRNTSTGGSGLGLTLAKAIVEAHGGTLTLRNVTGADDGITGLAAEIVIPKL